MRTRRDEVIELLLVGSAAKLEMGRTTEAGQLIERALRLSVEPEPLPGPWSAFAAYRLALVQLRCELEPSELERVVEHLEQAERSELFGPWPSLYRLAALARLGTPRETLVEGMLRVRELAQEGSRSRSPGVRGALAANAGRRVETMLEFFGLCVGVELETERGASRRFATLEGEVYRWTLVGGPFGPRSPKLPRSLAVAEFKAYQALGQDEEQLYFALPSQGTAWMSLADGDPEPSHPQGLRLLTHLLDERPMPSEKLRQLVLGPDASGAAWDKARSRLNKRLGAMLGARGRAAIVQDDLGRWVLSPKLSILGLVDRAALDPSIRRRGRAFRDGERAIGHIG